MTGLAVTNEAQMRAAANRLHEMGAAAIVVTVYTAARLHDLNLWMVYLIVYGIFLIGATTACRDPVERRKQPDIDPFQQL